MSILTWLKSVALLALTVFLGFGSYLLFVTAQSEKQLTAQASAVLTHADGVVTQVNSTVLQVGNAFTSAASSVSEAQADIHGVTTQLAKVTSGLQQTVALVNAPCDPGPCGTVADVGKTLNTARLTMGQVEIATNAFNQNESSFYHQEDQLYSDSEDVVHNLNTLLISPDLNGAIHNANTITYNLGETTGDFQNKFHAFLYPPPCKGFRCDLKKGYEAVKTASYFSEPAYWGWALFSQLKP